MTNDHELHAFEEAITPLAQEAMVEPPAHLDNAIKAKARRAVSAGPMSATTAQKKQGIFRRKELWQVPLSLAAGLVLGVLIMPGMQSTESTSPLSSDMVFMGDKHSAPVEAEPLANQPPEEWLRTIAGLLLQGEPRKAEALLLEFNRRFPDYSQD
ncbi:hypothetical protein [Endozoicomonas ascidiicola]|uniref:hypothetical protein n=1 Tax=Endozoicomonas ascidiicola TaxID=1698521 RepID=UPI000836EC61|nr:hypothetical protein [Endozoicomonas ascidiicola]